MQCPDLADHIDRTQGCELPDALFGVQTRCRGPEDLARDAAGLDVVIDLEAIRNARLRPGVGARAAAPALPSRPEIPAAKPAQAPP